LKRYYEQWQQGDIVAADDISPDQYAKDRGHYIKVGKGTPPPGATPS
jgi:hypothetical protein